MEECPRVNDNKALIQWLRNRNMECMSEICELTQELSQLKSKVALLNGCQKQNKKDLRKLFEWNENDVMLSGTVSTFTKEYLFPRFKFLDKHWMENKKREKSFSELVKKHLGLPITIDFDKKWDQVIAPTIAKKYTDIRCNINNECKMAFFGKYREYDILLYTSTTCSNNS